MPSTCLRCTFIVGKCFTMRIPISFSTSLSREGGRSEGGREGLEICGRSVTALWRHRCFLLFVPCFPVYVYPSSWACQTYIGSVLGPLFLMLSLNCYRCLGRLQFSSPWWCTALVTGSLDRVVIF